MLIENLPKKYKRTEAKIDSLVLQWFLDNYPEDVAIEVKITGGKLLEHQGIALGQVADGKFKYKIPDMGRKNPFDGFVLKKAHPFVVTCSGHSCIAHNLKDGTSFNITL